MINYQNDSFLLEMIYFKHDDDDDDILPLNTKIKNNTA